MENVNDWNVLEGVEVREYQKQAILNWRNNGYSGVFHMATGTGKTFTSILAMQNLIKHCDGRLGIVILCPYQHLVNQWRKELRLFGIETIVGFSGNPYGDYLRYFENSVICFYNGTLKQFVLLTTNDSFQKREIQYWLRKVNGKLLLVADEAHTLGTENRSQYLTELFDYRLGLSATFERYWDEEGTKRLRRFFGRDVFSYSLDQAIKDGFLTPYEYHPIICYLSKEENNKYVAISKELKKYILWENGEAKASDAGMFLLIERARLVAASVDKLKKLFIAMESYKERKNMLIYCGATKS